MKIAIVHPTFYVKGGAENVTLWLADELLRRGHHVTLFTSEFDWQDSDVSERVRANVVELTAGGHFSTWIDWWWAGWRLHRRLRGFDVVNPHIYPANVWVHYAMRFGRTFPPVVWYCQEPSPRLYPSPVEVTPSREWTAVFRRLPGRIRRDGVRVLPRLLQKTVYRILMFLCGDALQHKHRKLDQRSSRACNLILANSEYMAKRIRTLYQGRVEPCLPGIPLPALLHRKSGDGWRSFLSISRLEAGKHVDEIIRAIDWLVHGQGEREVRLVVIGTGTMLPSLKDQVVRAGLTSHIRFAGFVPGGELEEYYRQAPAVVCVSESEPFGLVPLEAMARGVPVIAARDGGLMESVLDGVTGICVPPRNVEALAMAMKSLLRDPIGAAEMGRRGREHVEARFSLRCFVDRFEKELEAIVDKIT